MAPTKMTKCQFHARGFCKYGESCDFIHTHISALPATERPGIDLAALTLQDEKARSPRICTFFMQGSCNKGDKCRYVHPPAIAQPPQVYSSATSFDSCRGQQGKGAHQAPSDSRARIPCKFLSHPGGCRKDLCPFLHPVDGVGENSSKSYEENEDEDEGCDDGLARDFSGASVYYNEYGDILKISLPTDFSLACITGLAPGATPKAVVDILRGLGLNLDVECVRILEDSPSAGVRATVKVENPLFAKELSVTLRNRQSALIATPMPIDARRTNCRKVYVSWHKPTHIVWLNFGNGEIANRVADRFNKGTYKCLGQLVKSSAGKSSHSRRGRYYMSYNPVAWTITLSEVPSGTTSQDVEESIRLLRDKPRRIEVRDSYRASDAEVSVEVRSHLEEHGPLESFYLAPTSKGKRVKASAWFRDEADARSACSLNNRQLNILGQGKLTVTLVQSAKIKVLTTVYLALKTRIDKESITWGEQHLAFHVYPGTLHTTLKVEGDNVQNVANARKTLEAISGGVVLEDGGKAIWSSALNGTGSVYKKLKSIEKDLGVVIARDKSKHQLRFHGPSEKFQPTVRRITEILREESSSSYEIDLQPHQFLWTISGGFKSIEQALGNNVAVFNVVSRSIIINGTQQQYETAVAVMDGKRDIELRSSESARATRSDGDCPICFCEADTPIQTSCKHTYCLECFEGYCKSATSTSKNIFQIQCQGGGGTCSTVFSLHELKDHVSSSVFEAVLKSSFEDYVQRHPETFRYCPTPDCGQIYRCTTRSSSSSGSQPPAYTCSNCLEMLCTSCHARHGDYTCAEFQDIASGGAAALERLKRELNIKDCPKCTTPMEKTEGCNHMTCGGCRARICWVCMEVFKSSASCYGHMTKVHGGIGLGLEHLADW